MTGKLTSRGVPERGDSAHALASVSSHLPVRLSGHGGVSGLVQEIALPVVDAEITKQVEYGQTFDELGDGLESHGLANRMYRADKLVVERVLIHVAYESAIYLQVVDGQVTQISE